MNNKAIVWLSEYNKPDRKPLMVNVSVDELATLYKTYIQAELRQTVKENKY